MAYDEGLAERIRIAVATRDGISERKLFSSLGFFVNGNMAVAAHAEGLVVRLDPEDGAKALKEEGVSTFPPGHAPMKGWVIVEETAISEEDALTGWVEAGLEFAGTLPAK